MKLTKSATKAPRFFSGVGIRRWIFGRQRERKSAKRGHEMIRVNQAFAKTVSSLPTTVSSPLEDIQFHEIMEDRPPLQIYEPGNCDDDLICSGDNEIGQGEMVPTAPPLSDDFSDNVLGLDVGDSKDDEDGKLMWHQCWDDKHEAYYYWNAQTNESTWLEPSEPYYVSIKNTRHNQTNTCIKGKKSVGYVHKTTLPREFECSITLEVMVDPVIAADGYTYEREAIEKW
eukprot:CAMPEP_0116006744 /NCGR_PEP_ID=MMETSP0321-20121206/1907_1 /TAXON_ID=163516 /ORGANISM="Leptocylindrus danicus var. danicus, Strain B650" /LENGTH=227 /DNA_ID=CAMNT_0003475349 /DNA_START=1013 /DNA_END=1693 /DNA_ORIENTATION=-